MASKNKKNKAKNSFLYNGGEKDTIKLKRIKYYNKKQRNKIKKETIRLEEELYENSNY